MDAPFDFAVANYVLGPATWYRVGGPARLALFPRSADEAVAAYRWMVSQPGRWLVLGKGSNVLISDAGFPGIVLMTERLDKVAALGGDSYVVESGLELDRLVCDVVLANNYEGAGAWAGIPGSVGGAMFMNAGTVNGSTSDFLESADLVTREGVKTVAVDKTQCGYRQQTFCGGDDLILRGRFRFTRSDKDQRAVYDHYLERRREKQPQGHCCGSVFKNPTGKHAGRLIEACGLKGARRGGAVISEIHANFIMNDNGATFQDIVYLINLCKQCVRDRFGIDLIEEVRVIE
ncbi:MAG TPA: UDP-N-acetylmuramate dehydrogenase [Candidatus Bathyarchaeia archaeon]|nr:UDP-N-acetylmuramate dehydrogenase [Candidatus Bathyarchaeia archaeon]